MSIESQKQKLQGEFKLDEHQINIGQLKAKRDQLIREAESAAHSYAVACEVGMERERAFDIYENIRNARRVY